MNYATLEKALLELDARRNSATFCSIAVQSEGGQKVLMHQEGYDRDRVERMAESAFQYYPGSQVTLSVFDPNGNRKKLNSTYILTPTPTEMGKEAQLYNQPQQSAAHHRQPQQQAYTQDLGLGATAQYLLSMKDVQLSDQRDQLREKADYIKILEDSLRKEKDKCYDLERDLKFKDKEFEIEKRIDESSRSTGLNGIIETASQYPQLVEMVLGKLLGGATPAVAPMAGIPQHTTPGLTQTQQELIAEINKLLPQFDEERLTKLYGVAAYTLQGQINLDTILPNQHATV